MPDPFDDPSATHRADREARKIAAEHETGHGRVEVLERHSQGDEGSEEAVGKLDAARCDDERSNLRSHRPARPHRHFSSLRPIANVHTGPTTVAAHFDVTRPNSAAKPIDFWCCHPGRHHISSPSPYSGTERLFDVARCAASYLLAC